ncbi:helix-turn-helix domain-containing protein [Micromonospora sp. L31]|uniref:helix-turn-helix domain-containing protein n=1 Tax=Micromonospora sp. L31 TaxID=3452213 RepID=UPI003F88A4B6
MLRDTESGLLQRARLHLADLLPPAFELSDAVLDSQGPFEGSDAVWQLHEQNAGYSLILVEAKQSLTPREVSRLRKQLSGPVMRLMRNPTVLCVAPWLSPRTRALLDEAGFSYLDFTGNVRLRIDRPAVYIRLQGADRDPNPKPQSQARLHGPKARRLVRLLVEATPPYRLKELAEAGGLTPGYVSKMLYSLDEQALVERDPRGVVERVDWAGLLLASTERYDLLRNNQASTFIAQEGARVLYGRMLTDITRPSVVVTGSFAASDIAKVAAPTQLVLYVRDPEHMRNFGRLLPTDRGADVVLLQPEDIAQVRGTRTVDGLQHVGLSQLVLDCLGGNGRLPEEGQAVLDWMRAHEDAWRRQELPELNR